MDTEGINHPLLEQLNLSCKYSAERRIVASCYHSSKSSRSQQSLSLDCNAKKNLNFQHVLWTSSSLVLLAWDNYLLVLGIREIGGGTRLICLSMLGINHSTHRTSITFCHKLLVNKLLNLPHQETSAASGLCVPVTQPSQKF